VGDELRDDLMVGVGEVGVGGPGNERQAVIGEVAYQRLVHSVVRWIVQGVLVYGHEPLDVIGDVAGGQAQHLLGRVSAFGPACLLPAVAAVQVGVEHLDEQLQGAAVAVVERRAGHPGTAGQLSDADL